VGTQQVEALRHELDALRLEVSELRASLRRLVLAADVDRCRIERDLHDGVQQHLVALAVNLQLAEPLVDSDRAAVKRHLEDMARDVQQALDETGQLAQRIYPPLFDGDGLAVALRSAATTAGIPASVEVRASSGAAPEVARTVYICWLEALDHAGGGAAAKVTVREERGELGFQLQGADIPTAAFDRLRDRVEALGGRLTREPEPRGGFRVSGSLPLAG
jgi:signal transduction histidine kinase